MSTETQKKDWTLEDYLENAPAPLAEMEKYDPEKYKKLQDDYFASNKVTPQFSKGSKDKEQLQKTKKQMLENLSKEELEEFKKEHPEEYDLIMNS